MGLAIFTPGANVSAMVQQLADLTAQVRERQADGQ